MVAAVGGGAGRSGDGFHSVLCACRFCCTQQCAFSSEVQRTPCQRGSTPLPAIHKGSAATPTLGDVHCDCLSCQCCTSASSSYGICTVALMGFVTGLPSKSWGQTAAKHLSIWFEQAFDLLLLPGLNLQRPSKACTAWRQLLTGGCYAFWYGWNFLVGPKPHGCICWPPGF